MATPVLLAAVRTPLGAVHGRFAAWHPVELLAATLTALVGRIDLDPADVDQVITGCVEQVGGQSGNIARAAVLAAGWPVGVGGSTVERGSLSGLEALAVASALVASSQVLVAIAAAVDLPSMVPAGAAAMGRYPFGRPWQGAAEQQPVVPASVAAERLAVSRADQDEWASTSVERAATATSAGAFTAELVTLPGAPSDPPTDRPRKKARPVVDELLATRVQDRDELAALPPMFDPDGTLTAGNTAPAADGAAAVVVADAAWAAARGHAPLACLDAITIHSGATDDAIAAASNALTAIGLAADHVDTVEIHESSAAVACALAHLLGRRSSDVNPTGGALALGNPTATATLRAAVSLAHRMARDNRRSGLLIASAPGVGGGLLLGRSAP